MPETASNIMQCHSQILDRAKHSGAVVLWLQTGNCYNTTLIYGMVGGDLQEAIKCNGVSLAAPLNHVEGENM